MELTPEAKTITQQLGTSIRTHRTNLSLSQEQLAESSELTSNYIGQLERGNTNPTIGSLCLVSRALGISLIDLFEEITTSYSEDLSPEFIRFVQYAKTLPPNQLASIHHFLEDFQHKPNP